jgi:heme/copper-type cytochrome/quinol oxidase subunit 2
MVMAGALLIFLGGFLKATWKLLYAAEVADVQWMSQIQFILVAPGFVALLVAVILIARGRKKTRGTTLLTILPWKIPFLALMTLASMGANGILTYISFKQGAKLAAVGFIVSFLCLVGMGAMASGEQTLAKQWIEESINALGQLGFMLGSILLYRNFKQFKGNC